MRAVSSNAKAGLKYLVESIADSRQVTRTDYLWLASSLLADHRMSEEERVQISRIFDHIQTGQLKIID
jgi:uncharacterized FlgJ-related protein